MEILLFLLHRLLDPNCHASKSLKERVSALKQTRKFGEKSEELKGKSRENFYTRLTKYGRARFPPEKEYEVKFIFNLSFNFK